MSTDRGFILQDFVVRIDNFNNPNRTENPEYTLAACKPPKANGPRASSQMNKYNVDTKGYMICNTNDEKRIENALRLVDWMYSDQAMELLSWGKEGVSYEMKDGVRRFIRPADGDIEGAYGVFSYGTYLRVDPEAAQDIASKEQQEGIEVALSNTLPEFNPVKWLALTDEEKAEKDSYNDSIGTYASEMLNMFILGQEPISKWDSFVAELNRLGVEELLEVYRKAYERAAA